MARLIRTMIPLLSALAVISCGTPEWPALWSAYQATYMDGQMRVIDRDSGDRTTSDGQAYAMFFTLVANDRARFDKLLRWTEINLARGDLSMRLPAWLWGRDADNRWDVIDASSRTSADLWLAYTLFEAGAAWNEPRYTRIADRLATRIADEEVVVLPDFGEVLVSAPRGLDSTRANRVKIGDLPLQIVRGLGEFQRHGPWAAIAEDIPALVRTASPNGLATDWIALSDEGRFTPSRHRGDDAMRVYLWAGMLDPSTPGRDAILAALPAMTRAMRGDQLSQAKMTINGAANTNVSVGASAALIAYFDALGERRLAREQLTRLRASRDRATGLFGRPPRYADQHLALFAIGAREQRFWFDARGRLRTKWMNQ